MKTYVRHLLLMMLIVFALFAAIKSTSVTASAASNEELFKNFIKGKTILTASDVTADKDGIISYLIKDLDSDGAIEMITFERNTTSIVVKYYEIVDGAVKAVFTEGGLVRVAGTGSGQAIICVTYKDNTFRIHNDVINGGTIYMYTYVAYKASNNTLNKVSDYEAIESGKSNYYVYNNMIDGTKYANLTEFNNAVDSVGFNVKAHQHVGYKHSDFDINKGNYSTDNCFKGEHVFTYVKGLDYAKNDAYGFIADNTAAFKDTANVSLGKTTGIKATQSTTAIKLTWNAVKGAEGYRVYGYDSKTNKYVSAGTVAGKTTLTISNLNAGKKYKFIVRAYVKSGNTVVWGAYSDSVITATRPVKTTGFKSTAQSTTAVKLAWSKVSGATGYILYKYNAKKDQYEMISTVKGNTQCILSKLSAGTKYQFRVRAYIKTDLGNVLGDYSSALTVKTKSEAKVKLAAAQSTTAIKLSWSKVSGVSGYRICYRSNDTWKKYKDVTSTSYTLKNLKSGAKYTFKVITLVKKNGKLALGTSSNIVYTATKPTTPTLKVTSTVAGKATLTWSNVNGESGYEIYYSTKKDSGFKKAGDVKANTTKVTLTNLTQGKTYYFRVSAYVKVTDGIVYGGYKTVGVKTKSDSNKLTAASAKSLWETANKVYNQWFFKREANGLVDKSTSVKLNGIVYYPVKHSSVKSVSDLKKLLSKYFDSAIYSSIVSDFVDYNGKLYASAFGRGGANRELKKVAVKSQNGTTAELNLTFYDIMAADNVTLVQKMKYTSGRWIFTDFFYMS